MKERNEVSGLWTLAEILSHLPDPEDVGLNQVWVGKNYSLKNLIIDLQRINNDEQELGWWIDDIS